MLPRPKYRLKPINRRLTMGGKVVSGRAIPRKIRNISSVTASKTGTRGGKATTVSRIPSRGGKTTVRNVKDLQRHIKVASRRIKRKLGDNVGKKLATAALVGSVAATSSYFVGKKVSSGVKPFSVNNHLRIAKKKTYFAEIKPVSEKIKALNAEARNAHANRIKLSENQNIKRRLYYLDEKQCKIVAVEMDAKKAMEIEQKQKANAKRIDEVVENRLKKLNKTARPEKVHYWNGRGIFEADLNVAKLKYISSNLLSYEKAQLDSIYTDVLKELKTNKRYSKDVSTRMGELNDTARVNYLASLSVEEFITRFGDNVNIRNRLSEVIKSLGAYKEDPNRPGNLRGNVLDLVRVDAQFFDGILGLGAGAATGATLLSLWSKVKSYSKRKKSKK